MRARLRNEKKTFRKFLFKRRPVYNRLCIRSIKRDDTAICKCFVLFSSRVENEGGDCWWKRWFQLDRVTSSSHLLGGILSRSTILSLPPSISLEEKRYIGQNRARNEGSPWREDRSITAVARLRQSTRDISRLVAQRFPELWLKINARRCWHTCSVQLSRFARSHSRTRIRDRRKHACDTRRLMNRALFHGRGERGVWRQGEGQNWKELRAESAINR